MTRTAATARRSSRRLLAGVVGGLALLSTATAAVAEDVTVSFDVSAAAGGLSASSASGTASLGSSAYAGGSDHSLTAALPALTVTDARGLLTTWSLSVSGTDWTDGGSNTVTADNGVVFFPVADAAALTLASTLNNMTITACACSATGATALLANDLSVSYTLASGLTTSLASSPSLTVTPSAYVNIPGATPQASYSNTVTFTVS